MYATFDDYTGRFGGRAITDEADFSRLAVRADAVLDRLTFGRAAGYRDREGKLAMACCAVTEKLYEQEKHSGAGGPGRILEEKVGDHQVKYRACGWAELTTELEALAEMYLYGTGLLYRGIPVEAW
jgi:hypothetical protein